MLKKPNKLMRQNWCTLDGREEELKSIGTQ